MFPGNHDSGYLGLINNLISTAENNIMCAKKNRKAIISGKVIFSNIPRNWIHQALTYMDRGELIFRLTLELTEIILVFTLLNKIILQNNPELLFLVSVIVVHTWNWITNSMFWALMLFTFPGMRNSGHDDTCNYLNRMSERLKKYNAISGLAIFGSPTRSCWHDRSDIDLRVVRNKGIINWFLSNFIMLRERMIAFIYMQPMDMYLADNASYLTNMRSDERPIFLIKRDLNLNEMYPGNDEINRIENLNRN